MLLWPGLSASTKRRVASVLVEIYLFNEICFVHFKNTGESGEIARSTASESSTSRQRDAINKDHRAIFNIPGEDDGARVRAIIRAMRSRSCA